MPSTLHNNTQILSKLWNCFCVEIKTDFFRDFGQNRVDFQNNLLKKKFANNNTCSQKKFSK